MTIGRLGCFKRPGLDHSRTSYFRSRIYPAEAYRRSPMTKIWMKSLTHPLFKSIRQTKVTHFVFASMSWHFKMLPISHSLSLFTQTLTCSHPPSYTHTLWRSLTHSHTHTPTPWEAHAHLDKRTFSHSLTHTFPPFLYFLPPTHTHTHTHSLALNLYVGWVMVPAQIFDPGLRVTPDLEPSS